MANIYLEDVDFFGTDKFAGFLLLADALNGHIMSRSL